MSSPCSRVKLRAAWAPRHLPGRVASSTGPRQRIFGAHAQRSQKLYRWMAYTAGVLGGEAADLHQPEALKAMAIAARTFAVKLRGQARSRWLRFLRHPHMPKLPARAHHCRNSSRRRRIPRANCSGVTARLPRHSIARIVRTVDHHAYNRGTAHGLERPNLPIPPTLAPRVLDRDHRAVCFRLDMGDGVPIPPVLSVSPSAAQPVGTGCEAISTHSRPYIHR